MIWGALNGFYLIFSMATAGMRERMTASTGLAAHPRAHAALKILITFALTCVAWVFFRAASLYDAIHVLTGMITRPAPHQILPDLLRAEGITRLEVAYSGALVMGLMLFEVIQRRIDFPRAFEAQPVWVRWPAYYAACMAIWLLGISTEAKAFIYFQF